MPEPETCKCGHQSGLHPPPDKGSVMSLCQGFVDIDARCPCARFVEASSAKGNCRECNQKKGIGFFIDFDPPTDEYICRSCFLTRLRQNRKTRR